MDNASQNILRAGQQTDRRTRIGNQQLAGNHKLKATVTHISTAMTSIKTSRRLADRLAVTVSYEL